MILVCVVLGASLGLRSLRELEGAELPAEKEEDARKASVRNPWDRNRQC